MVPLAQRRHARPVPARGAQRRALAATEPYIDRALSGESVSFEMAERNHAGQQRYMLRSYVPNRQANGEVAGIFVLIQDITDRRRTAEALHQAYQNLEQRVRERTAELTSLNDQLLREIDERSHAEAGCAKPSAKLNWPTCRRPSSSRRSATTRCSRSMPRGCSPALCWSSRRVQRRADPQYQQFTGGRGEPARHTGRYFQAGCRRDQTGYCAVRRQRAARESRHGVSPDCRCRTAAADFIPCSALVRSDIQLLARILRNLLTNAIRHTPGRVLQAAAGIGRACPSRSGIPAWASPRQARGNLQEFKRGEGVRPNQDRGLGLGLAIVDKIARMLGHRIRVSSHPPRFLLRHRRAVNKRARGRSRAPPNWCCSDYRVLGGCWTTTRRSVPACVRCSKAGAAR